MRGPKRLFTAAESAADELRGSLVSLDRTGRVVAVAALLVSLVALSALLLAAVAIRRR